MMTKAERELLLLLAEVKIDELYTIIYQCRSSRVENSIAEEYQNRLISARLGVTDRSDSRVT